jgi:DNA polymerase I-like protein with 3'-5' exonuclease and polymerase domains
LGLTGDDAISKDALSKEVLARVEQTEIAKLIKSTMENAAKFKVPLVVNIGIAQNWQDAH